jgi:hypothetical protein
MATRDEGAMTTAIDTNVMIALWDKDSALSLAAQRPWRQHFIEGLWSLLLLCSQS